MTTDRRGFFVLCVAVTCGFVKPEPEYVFKIVEMGDGFGDLPRMGELLKYVQGRDCVLMTPKGGPVYRGWVKE